MKHISIVKMHIDAQEPDALDFKQELQLLKKQYFDLSVLPKEQQEFFFRSALQRCSSYSNTAILLGMKNDAESMRRVEVLNDIDNAINELHKASFDDWFKVFDDLGLEHEKK